MKHFYRMLFDDPAEAKGACIALLGGGGKTSLLFRLGNELSRFHDKVLLTSRTRAEFKQGDYIVFLEDTETDNLLENFRESNPLFVMNSQAGESKLTGISESDLNILRGQVDFTVFECDGAKKLPLKAHTEYDPSVPDFASHAVVIVGADVIDTGVNEGKVHRPDLFKSIWKVEDDHVMSVDFIVEVLTSERGYASKIPNHVKRIYYVNKADIHPGKAKELARALHGKTSFSSYYGSMHKGIFWKV